MSAIDHSGEIAAVVDDKVAQANKLTTATAALDTARAEAERLARALASAQQECAEWREESRRRHDAVCALLPDDPAQWTAVDVAHALVRTREERDAALDIIEGRTVLPTDNEALAHHAKGGFWLVLRKPFTAGRRKESDFAVFSINVAWISPTATDDFVGVERVWSLDQNGRLCAWPVVEEAPGAR